MGHADLIKKETLKFIKEKYPNIKIAQWFLDRMDGEWKNNRKRVRNISEETNAEDLTEEKETMQNALEPMQKVETNSETTPNHDLNNNQDYTEEVTEIESEWDEWEDSPSESSDEPWKKLSKKERK